MLIYGDFSSFPNWVNPQTWGILSIYVFFSRFLKQIQVNVEIADAAPAALVLLLVPAKHVPHSQALLRMCPACESTFK